MAGRSRTGDEQLRMILKHMKLDHASGCWVHRGKPQRGLTHKVGYPRVSWHKKVVAVHRVVWLIMYGPPKHMVLHRCGNSLCVNPAHLYDGNHSANQRDNRLHNPHGNSSGHKKKVKQFMPEMNGGQ